MPDAKDSPDGIPIRMIRPDMRNLPDYPLPEGFSMRTLRREDAGLWVDVVRDAEPFLTIGDDLFARAFANDLPATEERCFFLVSPKGVAIGTISAWHNRDAAGRNVGQIHWFAIRPAWQHRGLARPMLAYALKQLALWHDQCFLDTQTRRIPAIKLYLDFGFVPDPDFPRAREAWREVSAALPHPVLTQLSI